MTKLFLGVTYVAALVFGPLGALAVGGYLAFYTLLTAVIHLARGPF